ncbi:hypothetical protein DYH09_22675 [bacterium CPR1]|nr:hypothetical protein [bacterium CPR1]
MVPSPLAWSDGLSEAEGLVAGLPAGLGLPVALVEVGAGVEVEVLLAGWLQPTESSRHSPRIKFFFIASPFQVVACLERPGPSQPQQNFLKELSRASQSLLA